METPVITVKISYFLINGEKFDSDIKIYRYTEKSLAFTCSEHFGKSFATHLKEIASYNPKLRIGKGWILSSTKYDKLQELTAKISSQLIKGEIPYATNKSIHSLPTFTEPPMIVSIKNVLKHLSETKEPSGSYTDLNYNYFWGNKDEILASAILTEKTIIHQISIEDKILILTTL